MKTQCPNCRVRFNTSDKNAGKQAKCPKCGKGFTIEPFVETPTITEPAAKPPGPTAQLVENPERIESPAQAEQHAKSPESAPVAKSETPEETAARVTAPAEIAKPTEKGETKSKTLSKIVFVYCWAAVRIIAGGLGFLGLMLAIRASTRSTLIAIFIGADIFWVGSVLIELMLFYRMWSAIQDGQTSTSPVKAVSFLFIPVFNFYWALLMLTGFVEDYNSFIRRRSVEAKELSFVLFLIYSFLFILSEMVATVLMICVFAFLGLIGRAFAAYPVFSWAIFFFVSAAGLCYFITYLLVAMKTCNAVNALSE